VGRVSAQRVVRDVDDSTDFTLSTVIVDRALQGKPASTVVVRQVGSKAQQAPAALMRTGSTYLLYLTDSGLKGDLASQYYVTGGDAGLYGDPSAAGAGPGSRAATAETPPSSFQQLSPDPIDKLPAQVSASTAVG
jgi:hypothetical protein